MKVSYNWLQEHIDEKLPAPLELGKILTTHSYQFEGMEDVDGDFVLDFDVQPNRAHDSLCHYGIAKEISILTGLTLKDYHFDKNREDFKTDLKVEIKDDRCNRYISREIKNVKVRDSSPEIKHKLKVLGQRSINNIVDLTNIVMFEIGQPTHVFDKGKIKGDTIFVRPAEMGEKFTTLDNKDIDFKNGEMVIADKRVLAVAGIKGGKETGVDQGTTDIILEAANFKHSAIRFARRDIGIQTDSSKRFEREISSTLPEIAINRLTDLILEYASTEKTEVSNIVDIYPNPEKQFTVSVSTEQINKYIGIDFNNKNIEDIWKKLKYSYTLDNDVFKVLVPHERIDLRIKEDLIEEVARIYGYENIQSREVFRETERVINKEYFYGNKIFNFLIKNGFSEIFTYVLQDRGKVEILNPMASDKSFMRDSLLIGTQNSLKLNLHNIDLLGLKEIKTFEIGKIFKEDGEYLSLAIALLNPNIKKNKNEENLIEIIKGLEQELGLELAVDIVDQSIVEINISNILERLPEPSGAYDLYLNKSDVIYKPFSIYPFILRDIAVWVPETVSKEELLGLIKENAGELLVKDRLFDEFKKEERVSYAFRLVFQSFEKTLTDVEVNEVMKVIESNIKEKGWEVR